MEERFEALSPLALLFWIAFGGVVSASYLGNPNNHSVEEGNDSSSTSCITGNTHNGIIRD